MNYLIVHKSTLALDMLYSDADYPNLQVGFGGPWGSPDLFVHVPVPASLQQIKDILKATDVGARKTFSLEAGSGQDDMEVRSDTANVGNNISVELANDGSSQTLQTVVTGNDIRVRLATDGGGSITSTIQEVIDSINGASDPTDSAVTASLVSGATGSNTVDQTFATTNLADEDVPEITEDGTAKSNYETNTLQKDLDALREEILACTDWTQVADAESATGMTAQLVTDWATYRQGIRDMNPADIWDYSGDWPSLPSGPSKLVTKITALQNS